MQSNKNILQMEHSSLLHELSRSAEQVINCFASVPQVKAYYSPSHTSWSAAQIIRHLTLVDRGLSQGLKKALDKGSYRVPFWKKFLPFHLLVRSRVRKVKAPEGVKPGDVASISREQLIQEYRDARNALIGFISDNSTHWGKLTWKHPMFGILSLTQTIRFIMAHEMRHMDQLKEVSS